MNNYFIKEGYKINQTNNTLDDKSGGSYWNDSNIDASRFYQWPVYDYAKRFIVKENIKKVVDVGSGTGRKLQKLNELVDEFEITRIHQPNAVSFCKQEYDFGNWISHNLEEQFTNVDNLKAGLMICADVIEHIENPDVLLETIKSLSNPSTYIILSTPEGDSLRGVENDSPLNKFHIREWNSNELTEYLNYYGFEILEHSHQYPIKFVFRKFIYGKIVKRFIEGQPLKYNQVCLIKLKA